MEKHAPAVEMMDGLSLKMAPGNAVFVGCNIFGD